MKKKRRISHSRYRRMFGIGLKDIFNMPRNEFADIYGERFRCMTDSKFKKEICRISKKYELGYNKDMLLSEGICLRSA